MNAVDQYQPHDDLCDLLTRMRLEPEDVHSKGALCNEQDVEMACEPSSDAPRPGCAYLQAIHDQLDSYSTTNGEYLEALFTHREIFAAFPSGHRTCVNGMLALAAALESREWRTDRDEDYEAVSAFRHEAKMMMQCGMYRADDS